MKWFVATAIAALLSCAVETVHANGRFPSAGHIEVDPEDPTHIVLRATYGLVITRDGGQRWHWVCEKAMSYGGIWDPPIGIMSGGRLLVGLPDGLSVSSSDACEYSRVMLLEGNFVADVAVDKKNPSRAVVLTSNPLATSFDTRLFLTEDAGISFVQLGDVFPGELRGLTVDLAASDPKSIYVSGVFYGPTPQGVVLHSANGGISYSTSLVPSSDETHSPYLGAVDPQQADRVYVRLDGTPGHLFVSEDGGNTWQDIFTAEGTLLGFSLSPDGKTLVVGGEKDGIWRSPAPNWAFEQTSHLHARCLRWADAGLFACTEQVLDGFSVGLSVTEGSTFKPLTKLADLCGPVPCSPAICSADWPTLRTLLGAVSCAENGASSSSSSNSSSSGGLGGMGGAGGNGESGSTGKGCGCHVANERSQDSLWLMVGCLALVARRNSLRSPATP